VGNTRVAQTPIMLSKASIYIPAASLGQDEFLQNESLNTKESRERLHFPVTMFND
jgi:hypothetical protein